MKKSAGSVFLRLDARRALIVLAIAAPILVADMILVLDRSRDAYTGAAENSLETLARTAGAGIEEFVDSGVSGARMLASRGDVVSEAASAAAGAPPNEESLMAIDDIWQTPQAEIAVRDIVAGLVAADLRAFVESKSCVVRALVTDRHGRTLAASHKPELFYHGDQAWWAQTIGDGSQGRTHVSGALFDPVTRAFTMAAAAPILSEDEARVLGAVRVFFEADGVTPYLEEALPGASGESLLVSSDGRLIASGKGGRSADEDVAEMDAVRPLLAENSSGAVRTPRRGGEALVGFVDLGLRRAYPEVDWTVLVVQDWREVNAPIAPLNRRALAGGAFALLLLGALAVYFTSHRRRDLDPLEEIEKA